MDIDMGASATPEKNPLCILSLAAEFFSKGKTEIYMKCELTVIRRQALIPFYLP
jgi:hypothetical protein